MSTQMQPEAMDHPEIEDSQVVERYLAGRLPEEDEARFEEHLFACTACLEQVEAGEELRRGLREVAAEEATRAAVATGFLAWLQRRSRGQLGGIAAFALAVMLLPSVLLWQQRTAPTGGGLDRPLSDFQMISLGVERDAGGAVEIRPEAGKDAVLLSLELPLGAGSSRYGVTLRDAGGEVLWQEGDLEPNLYDTLLVALPTSYLDPGSYRVTVRSEEPGAPREVKLLVLPAASEEEEALPRNGSAPPSP